MDAWLSTMGSVKLHTGKGEIHRSQNQNETKNRSSGAFISSSVSLSEHWNDGASSNVCSTVTSVELHGLCHVLRARAAESTGSSTFVSSPAASPTCRNEGASYIKSVTSGELPSLPCVMSRETRYRI